jgi:site-specific recombinase XerD
MATTTKITRLKEPASLHFKELKDGRKSIYLDMRKNGVRHFRALKLYLLPDNDVCARRHNAEMVKKAEKIKQDAILEHTYARAGLEDRSFKADITLAEWMRLYYEHQKEQGRAQSSLVAALRLHQDILAFDPEITLEQVDTDFINNFSEYLRNRNALRKTATGKVSTNTVVDRLNTVRGALGWARREQIIPRNPFTEVNISCMKQDTHIGFLTTSEVCRLMDAYCPNTAMKNAFLLGCFTGVRYCDLMEMRWGNVVMDGEHWRLEFVQQKTGDFVSVPLSNMARMFLPKYKKSFGKNRKVLEDFCREAMKPWLTAWAKDANIKKDLTFHMSRHTFATLGIEAGIDVYTVGKLLGHRSIDSTQVYSEVMDSRKTSTVNMLDALNLLKDILD